MSIYTWLIKGLRQYYIFTTNLTLCKKKIPAFEFQFYRNSQMLHTALHLLRQTWHLSQFTLLETHTARYILTVLSCTNRTDLLKIKSYLVLLSGWILKSSDTINALYGQSGLVSYSLQYVPCTSNNNNVIWSFYSNTSLYHHWFILCQVSSPRLTNGSLTCRSCLPSAADTGGRLRRRLWPGRHPT